MSSPRSRRFRGRAKVPGSFHYWGEGAEQVRCGPGQHRFANVYGAGCTYAYLDKRSLACGANVRWGKPIPSECNVSPEEVERRRLFRELPGSEADGFRSRRRGSNMSPLNFKRETGKRRFAKF